MHAYVSIGAEVLELHGPLAACLGVVGNHLPGNARETLARIARLDRERAPGKHAFDCNELIDLVDAAHALLRDPPAQVRKFRRVPVGALPAAERIGVLLDWLRERRCDDPVTYDLWHATPARGD